MILSQEDDRMVKVLDSDDNSNHRRHVDVICFHASNHLYEDPIGDSPGNFVSDDNAVT